MAISALDVRDPGAAAPRPLHRIVGAPQVAGIADVGGAPVARRRPPATVVAAAAVGLLESVALLAGSLTGLDGMLTSPARPAGAVVALVLISLAGWIVLCASGAATLFDGAGRRLVTGVACGELVLFPVLTVVALVTPRDQVPLPAALPLPAVALLVLAVPVGKLLLAGAPTALAWVAAGPRPRERRPDPVTGHRGLCVATLAVIGVALGALALLGPTVAAGGDGAGSVASATR